MSVDLSIIIPVYNGEKTIEQLLLSLIQNKNDNFEVIVIDDGSKDSSLHICERISQMDSRVKVYTQINSGVSIARNSGICKSVGKYIGFIDCDDSIKPDMYEKMLQIARDTDCDMVMGSYEKVNYKLNEKVIVELPFDGLLDKSRIKEIIYQMIFWDAFYDNTYHKTIYGSVWPNIYRTEIIKDNNITFPIDISLGEDLIFNIKYLNNIDNVYLVNKPMYEYNITNDSATRGTKTTLLEKYFLLLEKIHEFLKEKYKNDEVYMYNLKRQYINFAINTIEEQVCPSNEIMRNKIKRIKNIMLNEKIRDASKYMLFKGRTSKDRIKGMLFWSKMKMVVYFWLSKK